LGAEPTSTATPAPLAPGSSAEQSWCGLVDAESLGGSRDTISRGLRIGDSKEEV